MPDTDVKERLYQARAVLRVAHGDSHTAWVNAQRKGLIQLSVGSGLYCSLLLTHPLDARDLARLLVEAADHAEGK